jgi:hypothetical protein
MRMVPLGAAVMVIVMLAASVPKLFAPSTTALLQAVRALGPVSGWRCANVATYVYDPRSEVRDQILLAEAPEAVVAASAPEVTVERAEVSLRGSDAVLWTTSGGDARVYVLTPGSVQAIGSAAERSATCYAHQGAWRIVAEHGLQ